VPKVRESDKCGAALTENGDASRFPKNSRRPGAVFDTQCQSPSEIPHLEAAGVAHEMAISLLTGGSDRPYVFGLTTSLMSSGAALDLIGSDELDFPEFRGRPRLNFLNLRGSLDPDVSVGRKILRISMYYAKLIDYAATAKPRIFHILWNNKFEIFDRTLLMLYYRLLGKKIVFTVHNVNEGKRDSKDTRLNRLTLRIQYRLANHIFVHTKKMKCELIDQFGVRRTQVTVIPFGINNAVPNTSLTPADAKRRLGLREEEGAILFFGRITPYKGLEYLIAAFRRLLAQHENYRLIIAGKPDNCEAYWGAIRQDIHDDVQKGRMLLREGFIPDEETEVYFKAADVLVLPYRDIYQSGVLFLGHSFGLPALAADVGSFKDEIVDGKTGFVFSPEDPVDLTRAIKQYFTSDLYADLNSRRREIRDYATERHSWDVVRQMTMNVYTNLLRISSAGNSLNCDGSGASLDVKAPS
jgi:D-inositol-3-phosphate glycosyltransferase